MKFLLIIFMTISLFGTAQEKKENVDEETARIEILLRQQRELEADELLLVAKKNQKDGSYKEAIRDYKKAIALYGKSSTSEKRIIVKINNSRALLSNSYKAFALEVMKQAEKASSVELFDKAKSLLEEAKKTNDLIRKSR